MLQADNSVVWGTEITGELRLSMQKDGNLVVYDKANVARWASSRQGTPKHLVMQNDGNLVVYGADGKPLWARSWCQSKLWPGQKLTAGKRLCSPDGQYTVVMQNDGNFVIYRKVSERCSSADHFGMVMMIWLSI